TTDANGRFTLRGLHLGVDNAPSSATAAAVKDGYWGTSASGATACGAVTHLALTMIAKRQAHVSGVVYEGIADPSGQNVFPTLTVVPTASVQFGFDPNPRVFRTDATGAYAGDVDLGQNNSPRSYTATATAPGYWYQQKTVAVDTGPPKHVDFALVKQCTGT